MSRAPHPKADDAIALALVSGAVLAYEILLLRVFSFSQWHHFASMAVSLALLGFGAAGTLLAVLGPRAVRMGDKLFVAGLLTSAAGMVLGYGLPQLILVRPLFALWDGTELAKLLLLDFTAFIPFFGAAICIGQVFMRWPESTRRLYGISLMGSGLGAVLASCLLATVLLEKALLLVPVLPLLAGAVLGVSRRRIRSAGIGCLLAILLLCGWIVSDPRPLPLSDFKRLSYLLDLPDSEVLDRQPGLRGEFTVVRSDSIRTAPGLSLAWPEAVAPQDALVLGSDRSLPLPRTSAKEPCFPAKLASLPFQLRKSGRVAIVGTSEWLIPSEVSHRRPIWIEENADIIRVFSERGLLDGVEARAMDARGFLSTTVSKHSVICFAGAFNRGDAVSEDYLMTVEGVRTAIQALDPDGLLAIPVPLQYPPRYAPKLINVITRSLHGREVAVPFHHFAFLRSMQEGLLIVSRESLRLEDVRTIRAFAERWGFDIAALPGLSREETNHYHQLDEPLHFETAMAIMGKTQPVPSTANWYLLNPPTDDRPYFWHSMQWGNVPRLLGTFGRQGLLWLDWSLLATGAKVVVAGLLAIILILLPLGRLPAGRKPVTRPRVLLYFSSLGLGFLLLEMAVFQRCILYLSDPVVTASLVFSVFLVGAGLGSLTSPAIRDRGAPLLIFPMILATAALAFFLLRFGLDVVAGMPLWMRLAGVACAIAPLAWTLGQAFPWGLRQLDEDRDLIPWAWGINGFASVIAAPLATLLSVHLGQPVTWLAGAACYLAAFTVARTWVRQWNWYG